MGPLQTLHAWWLRFFHLSTPQKLLTLEAIFWLLMSMLIVKLISFRYWSRFLGTRAAADPLGDSLHCPDVSREVSQAIRRANRVFRGRFTCLMQAVAGKAMLNRRDIPNTLVLGARSVHGKNSALTMEAHAWLQCGSTILLGGEVHGRFAAVAQFHSPAPSASHPS